MALYDLTTIEAVKTWTNSPTTDNDAQVARLVTSASRHILSNIARPIILPHTWVERYNNQSNRRRISLRNWPVLSVSSVFAGTVPLSPVSPGLPSTGYDVEDDSYGGAPPGTPQVINFYGDALRGADERGGVAITYVAGYQTTDTSVAALSVAAQQPYGAWASDTGVVYANTGVALSAVAANPTVGQYSVAAGVYTFSSADVGATVLISYGFIPADLAQACVEVVARRLAEGARVGVRSKSLGGQETISYDMAAFSDSILKILQPYRGVTLS